MNGYYGILVLRTRVSLIHSLALSSGPRTYFGRKTFRSIMPLYTLVEKIQSLTLHKYVHTYKRKMVVVS